MKINSLDVIRQFMPHWFAVIMGNGIIASCLNIIPLAHGVATLIWLCNLVLFFIFILCLVLRTFLYPDSWRRLLNHPVQPLFLGCIPMGLATIINGCVLFGNIFLGHSLTNIALTLWWSDVFLSVMTILIVPYFMFSQHDHHLETMTALWLLPFVACGVCASSGCLLISRLALTPSLTLTLIFICIMLCAVSVILALTVFGVFFQRLCLYNFPIKALASSIWLPLGPLSTGALCLLMLGDDTKYLISFAQNERFGDLIRTLSGVGLLGGISLWGLATWWLCMALLSKIYYFYQLSSEKTGFSMGFWAYIFPLGIYTLATLQLGNTTEFSFFTYFSYLLIGCLIFVWLGVLMQTIHGAYAGYLIKDPTLDPQILLKKINKKSG